MFEIDKISDRVIKGDSVTLEYSFINDEILQDINSLLQSVLGYLDQFFLVEVMFSVLKEVLINATKANVKRVFFSSSGLDISNPKEYALGMSKFKDQIIMNWAEQEESVKRTSFYTKVFIHLQDDLTSFEVENNAALLPDELVRIQKRLESAKKYNDLADAFMEIGDTTESAGLGLVLTHLLLKNSGIGSDKFKINSNGKTTNVSVTVPRSVIPINIPSKFNDKILNEIEGLPPIPSNLNRIISLCNDPDTSIHLLSSEIEKDLSLAADLLKLSNSAVYSMRNKVNSILMAVKVVGLKNIKQLLYVSGVRKIMSGRYKKFEFIWEHSNKCSFFGKQLCIDNSKMKFAEIVAVGGLLHDIGKLVLISILDNNLAGKIDSIKDKDKNNSTIYEEFTVGISHSAIGAKIADKWSFPEDIKAIIAYHHRPFQSPANYKDIVDIVYLANMMVDVHESKASYFTIDKKILKHYNLETIEKFDTYLSKVCKAYDLAKINAEK